MRKIIFVVLSLISTIACAQVMQARSRLNHFPDASHAYWDVNNKYTAVNVSGRALIATLTGSTHVGFVRSTNALTVKTWFQVQMASACTGTGVGNEGNGAGVADASVSVSTGAYISPMGVEIYPTDCKVYSNNASVGSASWSTNQVGIAVDPATRKIWFCNPASITTCVGGGNPATGTTPTRTLTGSGSLYAIAEPTNAFLSGIQTQIQLISNPSDWRMVTPPSGFTAGF